MLILFRSVRLNNSFDSVSGIALHDQPTEHFFTLMCPLCSSVLSPTNIQVQNLPQWLLR